MNEFDIVAAYERHGSLKAVRDATGMTWHAVRRAYKAAVAAGRMTPLPVGRKTKEQTKQPDVRPQPEGRVRALQTLDRDLPPPGRVKRYLLTSAQNDTLLHEPTWRNLLALQRHFANRPDSAGCELLVARFTYIKSGLGASGEMSRFTRRKFAGHGETLRFAPEIKAFTSDERVSLAKGLVWCGEMNILPTATDPLSDLEVYTGRRSCVIPHPKIAMRSVPALDPKKAKLMYTTGTVTQRNYIQRKAGLKAEFHHCYGALLVEVDSNGSWWCRQLNADSEGTIYDLDVRVHEGKVSTDHRAEAIYWPDLHAAEIDEDAFLVAFEDGGMLDTLEPKRQFIGDLMTFRGRSHHEIKSSHKMFKRYVQGIDCVEREVLITARYVRQILRPWCQTIAPWSNHDDHLLRWLDEQQGNRDPVNAEFWLAMNQMVFDNIKQGVQRNPVDVAFELTAQGDLCEGIKWLGERDQYTVCPDANGGIECAMHGHLGPRGAKGSARAFAKMGRKACIGNEHDCKIIDGVYVAGTFSSLTTDWAKGPSNWTHTAIVIYPNGKRTLVTFWDGRWRA